MGALTRTLGIEVGKVVMPQNLISVCALSRYMKLELDAEPAPMDSYNMFKG
jgi:hypothetical protein